MNWDRLKDSKCPECNADVTVNGRMTKCTSCYFKCRTSKIDDLVKGKESKAYLNAVARNKASKEKAKKNRAKMKESLLIQKQEKISNLRRMLSAGDIDQKEYDMKMKTLK